MSGRRGFARGLVLGAAVLVVACAPGRDRAAERAVLRAALVELFATREKAQAIMLWHDPRQQSPTLSAFGPPFDHHDTLSLIVVDSAGLGLPFRLQRTSLLDMEAFFRENAAGWDAWFVANPGNAGIVELTRPVFRGDTASVVIGRACGESCRSAWRVTVVRSGTTWRVSRVQVIPVPR